MTAKAMKLLERMRQTKSGWKARDLIALYEGFGFVVKHGASHDIVKHPDFPELLELRATIPRHNELLVTYVDRAVKQIDRLLTLQEAKHGPRVEE